MKPSAQEKATAEPADARFLDRALFHGIAWSALWRWVAQIYGWAMMLYAARILTPAEFGLAAMCYVPIGLARLVDSLGLDAVVIQDRTLSAGQLSQLGGLLVLVAGVIAAIFAAMAVPIAGFFDEPALSGMIVALSAVLILDALQILPRGLLQRELRFRRLAWIDGLHGIAVATALAAFATLGFGAWSLVLNTLAGGLVVTFVLFWARPHALAWPRQFVELQRSVVSGGHLLGSRVVWYGYSNIDQTLIGRILGKADLGVYSFAVTFATVPIQEISALLGKVVPGVFSTVQHNVAELRRYYLMLIEGLTYATFPAAAGIALVADDLVRLALGPQWDAVVVPLQVLGLYAAFNSAQVLLAHVLLWTGHFRLLFLLQIYSFVVVAVAVWIGVQYGLHGAAWGLVIGFPLSTIPGFYFVNRILGMKIWPWCRALVPAAVACAVMAVVVVAVRARLDPEAGAALRLVLQAGAGALTYFAVMLSLYRARVMDIVRTIRGQVRATAAAGAAA